MRRVLAGIGLALACAAAAAQVPGRPAPALAQSQAPAPTEDLAVSVRVSYSFPKGDRGAETASWEAENVKYTAQGKAAPFKLVGPNIVVFVGITPFARPDGKGVVLIAEGQVGLMRSDGGFSYQATVSKIEVGFGESVLFLPLGLESPLRVYISVLRIADKAHTGDAAGGEPAKAGGR